MMEEVFKLNIKKKKLIITSCALVALGVSIGIIIPVLITGPTGPQYYHASLDLDQGARFSIISSSEYECWNRTDTTSYSPYFILDVVEMTRDCDENEDITWANISFYSPAGFDEFDHIAYFKDGLWNHVPFDMSLDMTNITAHVDEMSIIEDISCNSSWSVVSYPDLEISLDAKRQDEQIITLTTTAPGQILLPMMMKNLSFYLQLQAQGGNGSYSWNQCSGTLPSGFTLSSDGVLSGNATEFGNYAFDVRVSSADLNTTETFNLTLVDYISNEMLPLDPNLHDGYAGEPYKDLITNETVFLQMGGGNSGPYNISLKSGALPPGLSFTFWEDDNYAYANITGIPGSMGTFNFTMTGIDQVYTIWDIVDQSIGTFIEREYSLPIF